MSIIIGILVIAFAIAAVVSMNSGPVDKEYRRRQSNWDKYQGK
jgi:hypothetical protein